MRRRVFLLGGVAATTALSLRPANAFLGIDCAGPCATFWEQTLQLGQQIKSYTTQLEQLWQEVQTQINTAWSIMALPTSLVSNIMGDIGMLRGLASAASILTGNSGSIIGRLQSAGGYVGTLAMTPTMISNQFTTWGNTIGEAGANLGRLLDKTGVSDLADTAQAKTAEAQSAAAVGQLQAIQAGNEQMAIILKTGKSMNATLTGLAQEIATRDAVAADRDAVRDNATQEYLQHNDFGWSVKEHY
jgi:P-type conjugative transfer protein TrbJ